MRHHLDRNMTGRRGSGALCGESVPGKRRIKHANAAAAAPATVLTRYFTREKLAQKHKPSRATVNWIRRPHSEEQDWKYNTEITQNPGKSHARAFRQSEETGTPCLFSFATTGSLLQHKLISMQKKEKKVMQVNSLRSNIHSFCQKCDVRVKASQREIFDSI